MVNHSTLTHARKRGSSWSRERHNLHHHHDTTTPQHFFNLVCGRGAWLTSRREIQVVMNDVSISALLSTTLHPPKSSWMVSRIPARLDARSGVPSYIESQPLVDCCLFFSFSASLTHSSLPVLSAHLLPQHIPHTHTSQCLPKFPTWSL